MKILNNLPNPTAPTAARPDGALKDVSAPAAGDGTPAREDWLNDSYYGMLALMDTVGVAADDSDEEFEAGIGSQFLDAMRLFVQEWAYPGLDFGLQNISAGNQTSDITIYEAGGGSEKEDGFTVRLHWTGGDGTFNHAITSAYTIGNELAGFIASSNWQGDGAGELVLRLDKTNSKWLVLTPGIWDSGSFTAGEFWKFSDKSLDMRGSETSTFVASALDQQVVTFPINTANASSYYINALMRGILGGRFISTLAAQTRSVAGCEFIFETNDSSAVSGSQTFDWFLKDFWA